MSSDPYKAPAEYAGAGAEEPEDAASPDAGSRNASQEAATTPPDRRDNGASTAPDPAEAQPGSPADAAVDPEPAESVPGDEPAAEAYALAGEELRALTARAEQADEYLSLAQRTQADFENFRKRAARDAATAQERGATKLALALLPAVDNLERALAHAPEPAADVDDGGLVAGLRHVHSDVVSALQKVGIERFSPEGEPFDPQRHEAVAQQPVEGFDPGTVVEVFQRGYRIGDTVVRPARVVVAG